MVEKPPKAVNTPSAPGAKRPQPGKQANQRSLITLRPIRRLNSSHHSGK